MNFFSDIGSLIVPVSIAPELKDSQKIVCGLLTADNSDWRQNIYIRLLARR